MAKKDLKLRYLAPLSITVVSLIGQPAFADPASYRCQTIFQVKGVSPLDKELTTPPGPIKAFFTGRLAERRDGLAHNQAVEGERAHLEASRAQSRDAVESSLQNVSGARLGPHAQELSKLIEEDLERARTEEDIAFLKAHFETEVHRLALDSAKLDQLTRQFTLQIDEDLSRAKKGSIDGTIRGAARSMKGRLASLQDVSELQIVGTEFHKDLSEWIKAATEQNHIRREKEKRFDVELKGQSKAILADFISLASPFDAEITGLDTARVALAMEANIDLRKHVYQEMQFFRLASKSAALSADPSLKMRARTDLDVVRKALSEGREAVAAHRGLRKSIRLLMQARVFGKVAPKNALKPFTALQREQILNEALHSPELTSVMIGSIVTLPELTDRPPVKPAKPQKPLRPAFERMGKYEKKQARPKYKAAKAQFEREKTQWERDMAHFQALKERYQASVQKSKAVEARRLAAREAFIGYIAKTHPDMFNGSRELRMSGKQVAHAITVRQRATVDRRLKRFRPDQVRVVNETRSNNDSLDWMMMMYTGNPMWILNHDIAQMELMIDIFNGRDERSAHDFAYGLGGGGALSGNEPFGGGGASATWQNQVDTYYQSNPDVVQETSTISQASRTDTDLQMSNVSLEPSGVAPDLGLQIDTKLDGGVDPLINDVTPVDPANADQDWNDFVAQSDADWKDDVADNVDPDVSSDPDPGSDS